MNEAEKRVKILEVFHDTVRLRFSSSFFEFLALAIPVFRVSIAVLNSTDERTERLLHGSFGDQSGLSGLLIRPHFLLDS